MERPWLLSTPILCSTADGSETGDAKKNRGNTVVCGRSPHKPPCRVSGVAGQNSTSTTPPTPQGMAGHPDPKGGHRTPGMHQNRPAERSPLDTRPHLTHSHPRRVSITTTIPGGQMRHATTDAGTVHPQVTPQGKAKAEEEGRQRGAHPARAMPSHQVAQQT